MARQDSSLNLETYESQLLQLLRFLMRSRFLAYITFTGLIFGKASSINAYENSLEDLVKRTEKIARQEAEEALQDFFDRNSISPGTAIYRGKFSSLDKVMDYIPQIVKIYFQAPIFDATKGENELEEHMGTGFIYNADLGVICTNFHIVPNHARAKLEVRMDDGEVFMTPSVKIIGTSPGTSFGDFAFLQIDELAGKFTQMPIKEEFNVRRQDPVAFCGNSSGNLSIETGLVNDPFSYWAAYSQRGVQSFQVHLSHKGGASGSPVFNNEGEIIGILFAGDDTHAQILPIWYINNAFKHWQRGEPITAYTLGLPLHPTPLNELIIYKRGTREELLSYISDNTDEMKRLLTVTTFSKHFSEETSLQNGDIILSVNDVAVGVNSITLNELLRQHDYVTVDIFRDTKPKKLTVKVNKVTSIFMEHINIFGHDFYSANSANVDTMDWIPGSPITYKSGLPYVVESVDQTLVSTFASFVSKMNDLINVSKKRYFRIVLSCLISDDKAFMFIERPQWVFDIYIDHFNPQKQLWENIELSHYVTSE